MVIVLYTNMYTCMNTYSITNLRHQTSAIIDNAKLYDYVVIVKNSKQNAFIVDPKYFLALQEAYENYLDIKEYNAGKKSLKKDKAISFNQV